MLTPPTTAAATDLELQALPALTVIVPKRDEEQEAGQPASAPRRRTPRGDPLDGQRRPWRAASGLDPTA